MFSKPLQTNRRFDVLYNETNVLQPPSPYVYTASGDEAVRYINGKESFTVPWDPEEIYYVLYIVKNPGNLTLINPYNFFFDCFE